MTTRYSNVKVSSLADGETKEVPFEGDTALLTDVVEKAGFDLADAAQVLRNEVPVAESELEEITVRDGDTVFLVPEIQGG